MSQNSYIVAYSSLAYTTCKYRDTRVYLDCDESVIGEPQVTTTGDSVKQLSYVSAFIQRDLCKMVTE